MSNTKEDKNWPEDSHLENGNYENQCCICRGVFIGHKIRVMCRECYLNQKKVVIDS